MNTVSDISNKIIQCSQNDRLEIIISLRVFLFDDPVHYWTDFTYSDDYELDLINSQNKDPSEMKKLNELNIKKIGLKPIDLFLLPKNKKLQLISLIESIFEDLEMIVVFDKLRLNPFFKDELFLFLKDNSDNFSTKILNIYKSRSIFCTSLLFEASIEHTIYETCFTLSRKHKIIDYWINIWGQSINYKNTSLIEFLVL